MTIVLVGGPSGLVSTRQASGVEVPERVVVDHCGRHEHFSLTDEVAVVDGREVPVLRWSYSTAIAE